MPLREFYSIRPLKSEDKKLTSQTAREYYRPFILRTPVLVIIFLLILTLIGLVEYACRTLPTDDWKPSPLYKRDLSIPSPKRPVRRMYYGNMSRSAVDESPESKTDFVNHVQPTGHFQDLTSSLSDALRPLLAGSQSISTSAEMLVPDSEPIQSHKSTPTVQSSSSSIHATANVVTTSIATYQATPIPTKTENVIPTTHNTLSLHETMNLNSSLGADPVSSSSAFVMLNSKTDGLLLSSRTIDGNARAANISPTDSKYMRANTANLQSNTVQTTSLPLGSDVIISSMSTTPLSSKLTDQLSKEDGVYVAANATHSHSEYVGSLSKTNTITATTKATLSRPKLVESTPSNATGSPAMSLNQTVWPATSTRNGPLSWSRNSSTNKTTSYYRGLNRTSLALASAAGTGSSKPRIIATITRSDFYRGWEPELKTTSLCESWSTPGIGTEIGINTTVTWRRYFVGQSCCTSQPLNWRSSSVESNWVRASKSIKVCTASLPDDPYIYIEIYPDSRCFDEVLLLENNVTSTNKECVAGPARASYLKGEATTLTTNHAGQPFIVNAMPTPESSGAKSSTIPPEVSTVMTIMVPALTSSQFQAPKTTDPTVILIPESSREMEVASIPTTSPGGDTQMSFSRGTTVVQVEDSLTRENGNHLIIDTSPSAVESVVNPTGRPGGLRSSGKLDTSQRQDHSSKVTETIANLAATTTLNIPSNIISKSDPPSENLSASVKESEPATVKRETSEQRNDKATFSEIQITISAPDRQPAVQDSEAVISKQNGLGQLNGHATPLEGQASVSLDNPDVAVGETSEVVSELAPPNRDNLQREATSISDPEGKIIIIRPTSESTWLNVDAGMTLSRPSESPQLLQTQMRPTPAASFPKFSLPSPTLSRSLGLAEASATEVLGNDDASGLGNRPKLSMVTSVPLRPVVLSVPDTLVTTSKPGEAALLVTTAISDAVVAASVLGSLNGKYIFPSIKSVNSVPAPNSDVSNTAVGGIFVTPPLPGSLIATAISGALVVATVSSSASTMSIPGLIITTTIPEFLVGIRGSMITTSEPGAVVTRSISGSLAVTSLPGSVVRTLIPEFPVINIADSVITTSLPGAFVTTSVSGSLRTTSLPGSIATTMVPGMLDRLSGLLMATPVGGAVITTLVSGSLITTPVPDLNPTSLPELLADVSALNSFISQAAQGSFAIASVTGSIITVSLAGTVTTISMSGSLITTSLSGSVATASIAGFFNPILPSRPGLASLVKGDFVTMSLSSSVVTSSIRGLLLTTYNSVSSGPISVPPGAMIMNTIPGPQVMSDAEILVTKTISGTEIVSTLSGSLVLQSAPTSSRGHSPGIYVTLTTKGIPGAKITMSIPGTLITTTVSGAIITTSVPGYLLTTTLLGPVATSSVTLSSTLASATDAFGQHRPDRPVVDLTRSSYFIGSYLPTLLALIPRILVRMMYAATKMMEPFYCLMQPAKASAKELLNINYLSTGWQDPFLAIRHGHWLMLLISVLFVVVELLTAFASELLLISKFCNKNWVCGAEARVIPGIGRIVEGLLALSAVLLMAFWYFQRRHRSGIYADPSSIATMASLLHNPSVIEDFCSLRPDSAKKEIETRLVNQRYGLAAYPTEGGSDRYGLVHFNDHGTMSRDSARDTPDPIQSEQTSRGKTEAQRLKERKLREHGRVLRDVAHAILLCGLISLILVYHLTKVNNSFMRFWAGQGFGPRFALSLAGLLVQGEWMRIEREACILESFRELAKGQAPAEKSILVNRTLHPITTLLMSVWRRHIFVGLVALAAVLSEVLIITLVGIPFRDSLTYTTFLASVWVSIGILLFMLLLLIALYLRPGGPDLSRPPNTMARVFSHLCQSQLLDDFADLATVDTKTQRKRIMQVPRRYRLKKMLTEEHQTVRWTIDYDEAPAES